MTETLKDFYKEVLAAINTGKYPDWLEPHRGLCGNWREYQWHIGEDLDMQPLILQFREAGLDEINPFNKDCIDYIDETNKYTNPRRLAWIRFHASDLVVQSKSVFYGLKDDDFIKLGKFHAKDFAEVLHPGYSLYMEESELKAYNIGLRNLIGD